MRMGLGPHAFVQSVVFESTLNLTNKMKFVLAAVICSGGIWTRNYKSKPIPIMKLNISGRLWNAGVAFIQL